MGQVIELEYNEPLDFQKSLQFILSFSPLHIKLNSAKKTLVKGITIKGKKILCEIKSEQANNIVCEVVTGELLDEREQNEIKKIFEEFLSLKDNLMPFYDLADRDSIFKPIKEALYGYHQVRFFTPFEAACWAILSTRSTMNQATTMKMKLIKQLGLIIKYEETEYPIFPTEKDLINYTVEDIAPIINSVKKAGYIRSAIEFFNNNSYESLQKLSTESLIKKLQEIKGIGKWASMFIQIRGLGIMDSLTAPELELLKRFDRFYKPIDNKKAFNDIIQLYGQYKGYWAHYLRVY